MKKPTAAFLITVAMSALTGWTDAAAQGSITPIFSLSNTQQSTTSATLQNSDVVITAANLQNGQQYLILYSAAYGGSGGATVPEVVVGYGGTTIAAGSDEGSSNGTPEAMRDGSLHGYYILTGDGVSDLRIQWRTTNGGTAYITGKSLIAIPLAFLGQNDDYWFAQQNGDAAEVSTTAAFTDLISTTVNLPQAGDYLVLVSAEGWTPAGSSGNGEAFRTVINSVTQKAAMTKEWEDNNARRSFSYARIHSLAGGNNTITVQGGSGQGTASKSFRRGRIVVIRASSFDQLTSTSNNSDVTTTANHPTFDNFITHAYTPNQQEYVVVLGNTWGFQGTNLRSIIARLQNQTDAVTFSDFISDDAKDITFDRAMLSVFGTEQISTTKTYALQVSGESAYSTAHHFQYGDLIVWSMTTASDAPVLSFIGPQIVDINDTLSFTATATDPNGTTPLLSAENLPANATFFDNADGTGDFDFSPVAGQQGVYNVTFIASDGALADTEIVEITVTVPGQFTPVARVGAWTSGLTHTAGAGSDRLLVFAFGYENDGERPVTGVTYGGVAMTPAVTRVSGTTGFVAHASLWYLDEAGIVAATDNTFNVTVGGTAVAYDPAYAAATFENVEQTVPIVDADSNSTTGSTPNPLTIPLSVIDGAMSIGAFDAGNTGSYTWNNGWTEGADISATSSTMSTGENAETADGTSTASATHSGPNRQSAVAIALRPAPSPNQAPVVSDIPDQTIAEGSSFATINLDDYVSDIDNLDSEINWTYSGNIELLVDITARVATITTPSAEWNGSETITFTATDPTLLSDSDPATFTVTGVNDAPVVGDIPSQTIVEGGSFATLNLDDYVSDIDNLDSEINWTYSGNTELTVDIAARVATITTPTADWNGSETITFTATDPGLLNDSDPATFTVTAVNDAPVVVDIPNQTVAEGSAFTTITLDDYVSDVDNLDSEISWTHAGNTELTVDITARVATITIPDIEWSGSETITFTATDPGLLFDSDPATFTVTAVNDAPVVSDIPNQTVPEGSTFTTITLDDYVSDVDNLDSEISWTYAGNTELLVDITARVVTITTPTPDWNGSETITFTATDPGLLNDFDPATFTVTGVNDAPVVSDIPNQSVAEGSAFTTITLDDYVSDVDNLDSEIGWTYAGNIELTVSIVSRVATITIPDIEWNGSETITFTATDPGLLFDSDPATFTVTAVNDAPVVSDIPGETIVEGGSFATINLDDYASDIDNLDSEINWTYSGNTELTVSIVNRVATITIPSVDWNGSETITFTATDPGLLNDSDPATFTVTAVNDAPVVADIPNQTIVEGSSFTTINLDDYVSDIDNLDSEINWTYSGNTELLVDITARVATITTPNPDWNGSETITFTATDPGLLFDSDPATFTVTAVNDAPVVSDIPNQTIAEGSSFTTITLDDYVSDVDNLDSDISWTYAGNTELTVDITARVATITIPDIEWSGSETITFTATDPDLLFDSDPATFTVTAVNDAPVVSDIPGETIVEGGSFATINLDDYVSDID
ncbi:MAG TPA: Ig-like domain-containing protein, partial [candidate division Zixibacteria bacterium]